MIISDFNKKIFSSMFLIKKIQICSRSSVAFFLILDLVFLNLHSVDAQAILSGKSILKCNWYSNTSLSVLIGPDIKPTSSSKIHALRLETVTNNHYYNDQSSDGYIIVGEGHPFRLDVFGDNLENINKVKFTTTNNSFGDKCGGDVGHYQVFHILLTFIDFTESPILSFM